MVSVDSGQADAGRVEARRRQILEAAARCYRRNGFHATSMQELAREAKMSVGHIYHYFANKEAIIAAFIEEDRDRFDECMVRIRSAGEPVTEAMVSQADMGFDDLRTPDHAALILEMHAEASRNPKIAEMIRDIDAMTRDHMARYIADNLNGERKWTKAEIDARVEIMFTLFEGLTVRAIRNPDIDREASLAAFKDALRRLLA